MSKDRCDIQTDEELRAEVEHLAGHFADAYARQSAEREAFLNDHAEMAADIRKRMQVAKALYDARCEANMTQAEVAEKMNVSRPIVARLERGRGNLTLDTISRYARACGKEIAITLL